MRRTGTMFYSALSAHRSQPGSAHGVHGFPGVLIRANRGGRDWSSAAGLVGVHAGDDCRDGRHPDFRHVSDGRGDREKPPAWGPACAVGLFLYSFLFSTAVALLVYVGAPLVAEHWIGDIRTLAALRIFAACLPVVCLGGVMTGYFTAAGRIRELVAVEILEQGVSMAVTVALLTRWADGDPGRASGAAPWWGGQQRCLPW